MLMQSFLDVSHASDRESLERSLLRVCHELEFPLFTAMLVVGRTLGERPMVYSMGNIPAEFEASSASPARAARDPVNQQMGAHPLVPVTYDQRLYVDAGAGDLWEEQAPFGYRCGVAVALDLPNNRRFALGLDRDKALPKGPAATARLFAHLQLLAVHAQAAADRILPLANAAPQREISLTPRELEILRYTLDGKSNGVIGQLLSISERTVRFHLGNIFAKLDVSTRLQAALRASTLNLL